MLSDNVSSTKKEAGESYQSYQTSQKTYGGELTLDNTRRHQDGSTIAITDDAAVSKNPSALHSNMTGKLTLKDNNY